VNPARSRNINASALATAMTLRTIALATVKDVLAFQVSALLVIRQAALVPLCILVQLFPDVTSLRPIA